jgi:hypothetical protein
VRVVPGWYPSTSCDEGNRWCPVLERWVPRYTCFRCFHVDRCVFGKGERKVEGGK